VSAVLTRPAVRIGIEAIGRARDFVRRVRRDDAAFLALIEDLWAPIKSRHARLPGRPLRADLLASIERRWRLHAPTSFRIAYAANVTGTKGMIVERRLGPASIEMISDPEWVGHERGAAVLELHLTAGKDGARSRNVLLVNFSLHSLARFIERSGRSADADLIRAMNVAADADLGTLGAGGGGVKIGTDTDGGGWRGRLMLIEDRDGVRHRSLGIRTWLER
jgi:hypothetical protein